MKYFYKLYLIVYILYVVLGPHFIFKIIKKDKIDIVSNMKELISRMLFLCYVSMLFSSYFFYKPNMINWIVALLINLVSVLGFIIKWYPVRNTDKYYKTGIISHIIYILPLLYGYFFYQLNLTKYNIDNIIEKCLVLIIFLYIYYKIHEKIYY